MSSCGNCGGCSGCDRSLTMTEPELEVLTALAQIPFLPIGRNFFLLKQFRGQPAP